MLPIKPASKEEFDFLINYFHAIEVSGVFDVAQIRALVIELLDNPDKVPEDSGHWPLITFVRSALEQSIPLNWLTNAPILNFYERRAAAQDFIDRLDDEGVIYVQHEDPNNTSEITRQDRLDVLAGLPVRLAQTLEIKEGESFAEVLDQFDHLHVFLKEGGSLRLHLFCKEDPNELQGSDVVELLDRLDASQAISFHYTGTENVESVSSRIQEVKEEFPSLLFAELLIQGVKNLDGIRSIKVNIGDGLKVSIEIFGSKTG